MGFRLDRGSFVLRTTGHGGMVLDAALTRTGIFEYLKGGKIIRELRPASEVFKADSLATLRDLPVTDRHPGPGRVTPQNVREFRRGHVSGDPRQDENKITAALVIDDAELMGVVERRERSEVSCGYTCDTKNEPGEFEGQRYDRVQTNIRYNHVAIVDKARGGSEIRLRLDDGDDMEIEREDGPEDREDGVVVVPQGAKANASVGGLRQHDRVFSSVEKAKAWASEHRLQKAVIVVRNDGTCVVWFSERRDSEEEQEEAMITIDGIDYPLGTDAERKAASAAFARVEAKLKSTAETATGRADAAEEKVKALEAKLAIANDPKRLDAAVAARSLVLATARRVLGTEEKLDGLSEEEIMRKAVSKASPTAKLEGKSADYVRARFDSLTEEAEADPDDLGKLNRGSSLRSDDRDQDRNDAADRETKKSPREKMRTDNAARAARPLAISKDRTN